MQRGGLLDPGSISVRLRELAILRTTARCGAAYEFAVHAAFFAGMAGLSPDDVGAVARLGEPDGRWSTEDALVLSLADHLHAHQALDDDLDARLAASFDAAQRIELVMLCGLYHTVSMMCRALRLEIEPTTERWAALVAKRAT